MVALIRACTAEDGGQNRPKSSILFYGCSTVVLIGSACKAITVATVILRALDRVRERALTVVRRVARLVVCHRGEDGASLRPVAEKGVGALHLVHRELGVLQEAGGQRWVAEEPWKKRKEEPDTGITGMACINRGTASDLQVGG